jgi:hypothetical protein
VVYKISRILLPVILGFVYPLIPVQLRASTPVLENEPATNIYADFALLNCNVPEIGGCSWYDIYFVYYKEGGLYQKTATQHFTDPGEAGIWADSLIPETRYFFYPVVVTVGGTDEFKQPTLTFTTPAVISPTVIPMPVTEVTQTSATLNCDISSMGNCFHCEIYFLYGLAGSDEKKSAVHDFAAPGKVSFPVFGLSPGTTYSFRAVMSCCSGEESFAPLSLTTPAISPGAVTAAAKETTAPVPTHRTSGMISWLLVLSGIGILGVSLFIFRLFKRIKKT